jgi:tRNA pseudouridine55 synthase
MNKNIKDNARKINGILLLDKPTNLSSNAALQKVKRLYLAKKAGHTGSLDPLASGMLPICFGEATKFSQFLLDADKHYKVTAKLGITTTTDDQEGEIVARCSVQNISPKVIEKVLTKFRGEIQQIPSMYSALKHEGQPLYKLARQGITIAREPRPITIYKLDLLSIDNDLLSLEIVCSKGTYVRTLISDIGKELGCGAHVFSLRRKSIVPFKKEQMIALDTIDKLSKQEDFASLDKLLLPIEAILDGYETLQITEAMLFYLRQGQPVFIPKTPKEGLIKLINKSGCFLGIGEVTKDGKVAPKKLIQP